MGFIPVNPIVIRAQHSERQVFPLKQGYDDLFGFNLIEIARKIHVVVNKRLEEIGITFPQYRVVSRLWLEEELTQKELGDLLTLTSATLTPMIQLLEKKGWVVRSTDLADTRSKKIRLTQEGVAIRNRAFEIVMDYEREELEILPDEEAALMLKWLRSLNAHLGSSQ